MKAELLAGFGLSEDRVTVIPFGINNTLPVTSLTREQARNEFGFAATEPVLLFFGNIAPYKGVDVLIAALTQLAPRHPALRLVIAGRPKGEEEHWQAILRAIAAAGLKSAVRTHIAYIPDSQVEVFAKAADALVLPYRHVFQSGVLFLGYSFGLPVIATDVGSLREDIVEGETGWICRPEEPADLANALERWLTSDRRQPSAAQREAIRSFANERHSWTAVGAITRGVYERLLRGNDSL
jgi:glycosyltransferase involved in cell wall biosynthesis